MPAALTAEQHIQLEQHKRFPQATGAFSWLYEANPIALIAEQAGGMATDGVRRILEIEPHQIHQRVPLVVGGSVEVQEFSRCTGGFEQLPSAAVNDFS